MSLGLDEALLIVQNNLNNLISVYNQIEDCINCPLILKTRISPQNNGSTIINTQYRNVIEIRNQFNEDVICKWPKNGFNSYENQGEYLINVDQKGCNLENIRAGVQDVWPILIAVGIYVLILLINLIASIFWKRIRRPVVAEEAIPDQPEPRKSRVKSIDTFRG